MAIQTSMNGTRALVQNHVSYEIQREAIDVMMLGDISLFNVLLPCAAVSVYYTANKAMLNSISSCYRQPKDGRYSSFTSL